MNKWVRNEELVTSVPIQYADNLKLGNINMNGMRSLFPMDTLGELLSQNAQLNSGNNGNTNIHISLNIGNSNTNTDDDSIGDKDRRDVGFKHVWEGCKIGDNYTVISEWDGNKFIIGSKQTMISKDNYNDIIANAEANAQILYGISGIGMLGGIGYGLFEIFGR